MQNVQMNGFSARLARVEAGGANTFSTIHAGNLRRTKRPKASKANQLFAPQSVGPSRGRLMRLGLRSGLMQAAMFGVGLILYLNYVGL